MQLKPMKSSSSPFQWPVKSSPPGLSAQVPTGRRRLLSLVVAATLASGLWSAPALAADAQVDVFAFDEAGAISDLLVQLNDGPKVAQDEFGALTLRLPAGEHRLRVYRGEALLSEIPITTSEDEIAQIIVNLPRLGEPQISFESSAGGSLGTVADDTPSGPPGLLEGQILSVEDGQPVAGARIFVSGTPIDVQTDAEGRYRIELPPGDYSLSVLAASFNAQTITDIQIASEQTASRAIELTPAGLELPDFVVLEPYVEGSLAAFAEERRSSSAVTDVLGAEQISRAGDSDAAGALKRVTGLTLVDGKFIYVRGLGERYSSVLLNGAQIPSPDPTRRVVPLDLFPTDILEGVVIQKTYSADMPAEFAGGTIQLRTKSVPESFFLRASIGLGYADGTTGEDGLRYAGGNDDWTGFDDGTRELPSSIAQATSGGQVIRPRSAFNPNGFTAQEIEVFGDDLADVYEITRRGLGPEGSMALSGGGSYQFGEAGPELGIITALRYSQSWDSRDEIRRNYQNSDAGLTLRDELMIERTERNIDLSGYTAVGLKINDNHSLSGNVTLVRTTQDEARISTGNVDNQDLQRSRLEWVENELIARQLQGEHLIPQLGDLAANWNYTRATATRYEPNTREYRYDVLADGSRRFSQFADSNSTVFGDLEDNSESWDTSFSWPWQFAPTSSVKLLFGVGDLDRDRVSGVRRFTYNFGRLVPPGLINEPNPEDIFNDTNIFPNGIALVETTTASDTYTATQALDYYFAGFDLGLWEKYRLVAGWRRESNFQQVTTRDIARPNNPPVVSTIEQEDILPAFSATWYINGESQLRLGYSETVSRPDFRELSPSPFLDPLLDAITIGNPDLKPAEIENIDLRYEYYFSPTESFSIAAFRKTFVNPIEKQRVPGVGVLLELANALGADNRGVELDLYKSLSIVQLWDWLDRHSSRFIPWQDIYLGLNYAYIDSNIVLDPAQSAFNTNSERQLEGQSPYVVNFQLAYQEPEGKSDWTLLYNRFGERIVQVGIAGQPDIFEEPFDQLDFVYRRHFERGMTLGVRLRNLLDPEARFVQGPEVTRSFKKGREFAISLSWKLD